MCPKTGIRIVLPLIAVAAMLAIRSSDGRAPAGAAAARPTDRDTTEDGVFVRDSAIAADKFELGKRMERLKEWPKSADVYNEILEKYQDRVVPTALNNRDQPIKFQSVAVAVQERLCRWPQEGLTVYRTRFEPIAAALLDQTKRDDFATLHKILGQYFVTDSAREAGIRLIDLYLEGGDFSAAAWIGDRLLTMHPNLGNERAAVLFRTALAHHLSGNANLASRRLDELKKNFPNEKTIVAGKEVAMVDALAAQLTTTPPRAVGSAEDSWRTLGGDETRNLVGSAAGRAGARSYSIPLPPMVSGNGTSVAERIKDDIWVNIMPAVDHGELFFQDGQRMYAVHLDSGIALPGWQQQYPQRMGQYQLPGRVSSGPGDYVAGLRQMPQQFSITVTDDSVVAVMGQPVVSTTPYGGMTAGTGTKLVCLDRETGREKWIADPATLPNNAGGARNLNFSGCPLVVGDNVYTTVRGSSGGGVEDCHVACYDLQTGAFNWVSYIASAQSGVSNIGNMAMSSTVRPDTLSHLAFASGRVFVMTNLGAVAAIDAYSGTTLWLSLYPRDQARLLRFTGGNRIGMGGLSAMSSADWPKPWEYNPVVVQDGKVFSLPTDGTDLTVYDALTGDTIKRIQRDIDLGGDQVQRLSMLLSVSGDTAIVAGTKCFMMIDWAKFSFRPDSNRPGDKSLLYASNGLEMRGRPFVTTKYAYLPMATKLGCFDLTRTKLTDSYPRGNATDWPADEGPGNVIVTRDHVIVANARNVSVYTDLGAIRQKYDIAIKNNPTDVDARMVFAEMMFNARELPDARSAMDDAIQVLGGINSMRVGPQRERVFSDAMLFAQKLTADQQAIGYTDAQVLAIVDSLYDRAAAAAVTPSQQVSYRFSRARFIVDTSKAPNRQTDFTVVARLYQEVISDPQMRIIMLSGDENGSVQAGHAAEKCIEQLIAMAGSACYKAFEDDAARKLTALSAGGTPDQLLALAEDYPNAVSVSATAMMQAADAYEQAGNMRMASNVLRRISWQYPKRTPEEKGKLVEAMARVYLKLDNPRAALGRIQQYVAISGDRKLSGPLPGADGKPLTRSDTQPVGTFGEAVAAIQAIAATHDTAALPDVGLPTRSAADIAAGKAIPQPFEPENDALNIPDVQAIIKAQPDEPTAARYDRIVLWSAGQLVCFTPGQAKAIWASNSLGTPAQGLIWSGQKLLAWSQTQVAQLDGTLGKAIWRIDLASLPPVELVADQVSEPKPQPPQPAPPAATIAPARIGVVRPPIVQPPVAPPLPPNDGRERVLHVHSLTDRVIVSTTTGRICAFDVSSGRLLWQTRLASTRAIQQTLSTDEFTAIRLITEANTAQIVVLDTFNGQQVYRRNFATGTASSAMNCILSPDGILVWTSPQAVAGKDLYEAGDAPTWTKTSQGNSYSGMIYPNQLALWGQQVLVLCDGGRMIERRWLRNGDQDGKLLSTQSSSTNSNTSDPSTVRLHICGSRMFAVGSTSGESYDLESGASTAMTCVGTSWFPNEVTIAQHHVLLPGRVESEDNVFIIQASSRELIRGDKGKSTEGGRLVYSYRISGVGQIRAWAVVDGGIYYLAADEKLHWLQGARP